jgi:hypothetical protein
MVPKQAALWERVQCVAPGNGEVNLPAFHRLALWHHGCIAGGAGGGGDREETLNQAIESLNSCVRGYPDKKLLLTAVSQQTKVPKKTLLSQMNDTHLSYGELLTANSLVEGSGKNVNEVLAMKKGKGWAGLSIELRIDPNSIVNRLRTAEKTVRAAQ